MRLDLAEDVGELITVGVAEAVVRSRAKPRRPEALDDAGVVRVGLYRVLGVSRVGIPDHVEQRVVHGATVDDPGGIEDLVAAVLGVDVGEHDKLDVSGIATQALEGLEEVVDFRFGHG